MRESQPNNGFCGGVAQNIRVGRLNATDQHRGLLDFNVSSIPQHATVTSASVKLYQDASKTVGTASTDYALFTAGKVFNGAATWNTSGASGPWDGGTPGNTAYGTFTSSGSTPGYKTFGGNVTSLVQSWVANPQAKTGFVVKQHTGPVNTVLYFVSSSGPSTQRPAMNVNYTLPPNTPTAVTAAPGGVGFTTSLTPTLTATVQDPDGAQVRATFALVHQGATIWSAASPYVASNSSAAVAVPPDVLTAGDSYTVLVSADDGEASSGISTASLVVDVAAATVPASACSDTCRTLSTDTVLEDSAHNLDLGPGETKI